MSLFGYPQWVNLATVGLLLFAPGNLQLEAAVYALADGPLAAALIAWQSAWVFGSPSHVIRCALGPCAHLKRTRANYSAKAAGSTA